MKKKKILRRRVVGSRLPDETYNLLIEKADQLEMTLSETICFLLTNHLKKGKS